MHFQPDRALTGNNRGVVIGVDKNQPFFLRQAQGVRGGLFKRLTFKFNFGAVFRCLTGFLRTVCPLA